MAESETRIRIRHQNQILLVILICVLASLRASSQTIINGKKIHELPIKDTVKSDFLFMQGNNINGKLYKTPMSTLISAVSDSVILDTTSLSNRIDLKLNKSDTVSLSNRINVKMGYSDTAGLSNRINLKENAITAGTTSQYWRGDKSWQTLTIPSQFNPIAGSNVTITGTYPNITFNASTDTSIVFDSRNSNYTFLEVNPIKSSQPKQTKLSFIRSANYQGSSIPDNEVYVFGFNLNGGGGKIDPLQPSIGESWESGYFPIDDSSRFIEKHEIYYPNNSTGAQVRLSSYTINSGSNSGTGEGFIDFYNTVNKHYYKNPENGNIWYAMQPRKLVMYNDNGSLDNATFEMDTIVNAFIIHNQGAGTIKTFNIDGFDTLNFGNPNIVTGMNISSTKTNSFYFNSTAHNTNYIVNSYQQGSGYDQTKLEMHSNDGPYVTHKLIAYDGLYPTYSIEGSGTADMLLASFTNLKILMPVAFANSNPHASAQVDIPSTTKGFLPPRMTTTQKNAISSPAEGLTVYDTTLHKLCVFDGSTWQNAW